MVTHRSHARNRSAVGGPRKPAQNRAHSVALTQARSEHNPAHTSAALHVTLSCTGGMGCGASRTWENVEAAADLEHSPTAMR